MNTDITTATALSSLTPDADAISYPDKVSRTDEKNKRTSKVCTMCHQTRSIQDRYKNGRCDGCRTKAKKQKELLKFEKPTPRDRTRQCRACEKTYTENNRRNGCCSNKCLNSITPDKVVNCAECGLTTRTIKQEPSVVDFNTTCCNRCALKFKAKYEDELYANWVSSLTPLQVKKMFAMESTQEVIAPLLAKSYTPLHAIRIMHHHSVRETLVSLPYKARHDKKLDTNLRILVLGFQQQFLATNSPVQTNQTS